MRIDDDQDAAWLRVRTDGDANCHFDDRSRFHRSGPMGRPEGGLWRCPAAHAALTRIAAGWNALCPWPAGGSGPLSGRLRPCQ
nr:hypothetical protein [Rhodovulum sulfidophilum]